MGIIGYLDRDPPDRLGYEEEEGNDPGDVAEGALVPVRGEPRLNGGSSALLAERSRVEIKIGADTTRESEPKRD